MSLKKYVIVYNKLVYLIKKQSTGTPDELSRKFHVSKRQAQNYIRDLNDLGFKVKWSHSLRSYYFKD